MIIQCDSCQTKFRIDDSKVGEKGVKVRCTKCKNVFVVKHESEAQPAPQAEAPQAPPTQTEAPKPTPQEQPQQEQPPAAEEGGFSFDTGGAEAQQEQPPAAEEGGFSFDTGGAEAQQEQPPAASEQAPGGFDFGFGEESTTGGSVEEETAVGFGQDATAGGEQQDAGGEGGGFDFGFGADTGEQGPPAEDEGAAEDQTIIFSVDDKGGAEPTKEEAEGAAEETMFAPPPTEQPAGEVEEEAEKTLFAGGPTQEESESAEEPSLPFTEEAAAEMSAPPEKGKAKGKKGLSALLLILILIGGAAALYVNGYFDDYLTVPEPAVQGPTISIQKLEGKFLTNDDFGLVFVLEGRIKNLLEEPQKIRGVRATLLRDDGRALDARTVAPDILVSSEELKTFQKSEINKRFEKLTAADVPAMGMIPFMVVFTDAPGGIAEAEVEVIP